MATRKSIINQVSALVRRYGTRDPFVICERLQIAVKQKPLCPQLKAYFFYQSRMKTVILNTDTDGNLRRVLCAHELGHAVLHTEVLMNMRCLPEKDLFDQTERTEFEANAFAAELLIPDGDLLGLLAQGFSLFEAAPRLCLPPELLDFKLRLLQHKGHSLQVPYLAQSDFLRGM